MPYFASITHDLRRKDYRLRLRNENEDEKERDLIGQYGLYTARNGSKPMSPIPISIPMTWIFDFVILSDISAFILYANYYYYS
jgi:hypothetical protein